MSSDDRPPERPLKPPAPRASAATPAKPAPRAGAQQAGDSVEAAYQDLLQEIVEKKKKTAEVRNRPKPKKKGPLIKAVLAVVLPPVVALFWIFNPFDPGPPPPPHIPDDMATWRAALIDAAQTIHEWRDSAGGFPVDLETADVPLRGVTFDVTGPDQFTLQTFTSEGIVIVWMDGDTLGVGPRTAPAPPPLVTP